MKQPTFHGRVLLPLSVFADARQGASAPVCIC